jgi:hypothetical protein
MGLIKEVMMLLYDDDGSCRPDPGQNSHSVAGHLTVQQLRTSSDIGPLLTQATGATRPVPSVFVTLTHSLRASAARAVDTSRRGCSTSVFAVMETVRLDLQFAAID